MLKDFFTNDEDNLEVINLKLNAVADQETFFCCDKPKKESSCEDLISLKHSPVNDLPLAMAYVPMQRFEDLYCPSDALNAGTLFKKLDLPFLGYKKNSGGGGACK